MDQPMAALPDAFSTERMRFIAWVRKLEREALTRPGGSSRWYQGDIFSAYVRSTNWRAVTPGHWTVCFANVEVREDARGQGFFTGLLQALAQAQPPLRASVIYVEHVQQQRLAKRLRASGFTAAPGGEGCDETLYRLLPVVRSATKETAMSQVHAPGSQEAFFSLRSRLEDAYAALIERCERSNAADAWAERATAAQDPGTPCEQLLQRMADLMGEMDLVHEPGEQDSARFSERVRELTHQANDVATS